MSEETLESESIPSIIRKRILTGLFLLFPVGVTLWIVYYIMNILTGWSIGFINLFPFFSSFEHTIWLNLLTRIVSIIFLLFLLFCIGQFAKFAMAQKLMTILENMALQLPMFRTIYSTIKQILEAIRSTKSGMFRQVVLVEYPRKGMYGIGFLTNNNSSGWEIGDITGKELLSIFLPTTPNPTSGFLLLVPREECVFLDMDVSEGMKLVISGGVISPKEKPKTWNASTALSENNSETTGNTNGQN